MQVVAELQRRSSFSVRFSLSSNFFGGMPCSCIGYIGPDVCGCIIGVNSFSL